ncbi:MAG TPA: hypothetical protein VF988_02650, partial [Verrucomicrobiae bacterium]
EHGLRKGGFHAWLAINGYSRNDMPGANGEQSKLAEKPPAAPAGRGEKRGGRQNRVYLPEKQPHRPAVNLGIFIANTLFGMHSFN